MSELGLLEKLTDKVVIEVVQEKINDHVKNFKYEQIFKTIWTTIIDNYF